MNQLPQWTWRGRPLSGGVGCPGPGLTKPLWELALPPCLETGEKPRAAEAEVQGSQGPDLHGDLNPSILLICCVTLGQLPALSELPRLPVLENGFGNKNLTFQGSCAGSVKGILARAWRVPLPGYHLLSHYNHHSVPLEAGWEQGSPGAGHLQLRGVRCEHRWQLQEPPVPNLLKGLLPTPCPASSPGLL